MRFWPHSADAVHRARSRESSSPARFVGAASPTNRIGAISLVSLAAPARLLRVGAHLESALRFKINVLSSTFIPLQILSVQAFGGFALDYMVLGDACLERRRNRLGDLLVTAPRAGQVRPARPRGGPLLLRHGPAEPARISAPRYVPAARAGHSTGNQQPAVPLYLALQSAMLNESASCSAAVTTITAATPASSST